MKKAIFLLLVFLVVLGLSSCKAYSPEKEDKTTSQPVEISSTEETQPAETTAQAEVKKITVYFPDSQAMYLVPEQREINGNGDVARIIVEEIFKGPKEKDHLPVVPSTMPVPDVKIEDKTAYVDFPESVIDVYPKGSTGENLFIYAIVNSLVENTGVKEVWFYINGKPQPIPGSNYDFSVQSFTYNNDIVQK